MSGALPPPNKVFVGDCLRTMNGWAGQFVDLVFADPPYNIGYKYDQYNDSRSGDDYVQWTEDWIDQCARVLKPTGSLYVLIGDEYAAEIRLHLKRLEAAGSLQFRNWIVWHYTFGQNCRTKFNRSHAHLFYCVGSAALAGKWKQSAPPFTFNRDQIAIPSARQTAYSDARANPKGKLPDDTWYLRPQETNGDFFHPDQDTWVESRLCGTFRERVGWHPCQLPEALLERIVQLSSRAGDLVFDPFVGSGTTLAVAARLQRNWLGCELSTDYARRARQRIRHSHTTGETLKTGQKEKGIERGKPKKKAEPHRSPHLRSPKGRGKSGPGGNK
ncbi:MAG: site-specific DNA-methyltransferase [Phycisphaerae bacterium]|nr:site-specific DNA-methyltransferase [Phycisphaerae bacterium]